MCDLQGKQASNQSPAAPSNSWLWRYYNLQAELQMHTDWVARMLSDGLKSKVEAPVLHTLTQLSRPSSHIPMIPPNAWSNPVTMQAPNPQAGWSNELIASFPVRVRSPAVPKQMYTKLMPCTNLWGKEPHRQVGVGIVIKSRRPCGVMVAHWPGMSEMWVSVPL